MSAMAGFSFLFCVPIGIAGVVGGNWDTLAWLLVPLVILLAGKWLQRLTPEYYAVLHPGKMILPGHGKQSNEVVWERVESIRWPQRKAKDAPIIIKVASETGHRSATVRIDLQAVAPADRVTLIRYLRSVGKNVEQTGWPKFCFQQAVPLVEALQRKPHADTSYNDKRSAFATLARYEHWMGRHPFAAGMLLVIIGPLLVHRMVSRSLWWTTATLIALSTVINIRLVWGGWVSPFAEICLGTVAIMFLAGLVAPTSDPFRETTDDLSSVEVVICLAVCLIGLPLLGNALARGWIAIPKPLLRWILLLLLAFPFLPALKHNYRQKRKQNRLAPLLEAEAIRRWDAYVETDELPRAEVGGKGEIHRV